MPWPQAHEELPWTAGPSACADGRFTLTDGRGSTGAHDGEYKINLYPRRLILELAVRCKYNDMAFVQGFIACSAGFSPFW